MSTEAWKDSGNCKDCRRVKYCKKPCTANKRRAKEIAEQAARAVLAKTRREDMKALYTLENLVNNTYDTSIIEKQEAEDVQPGR